MFHIYWCTGKPWSSSIILYNGNIIAQHHHTHNGINVFLYLYISTSTFQRYSYLLADQPTLRTPLALKESGLFNCRIDQAADAMFSLVVTNFFIQNITLCVYVGLRIEYM